MIESTHIIYLHDEMPLIGSGWRKIHVKKSEKYAYISDNFGNKIRFKLKKWLEYQQIFKI